MKTANTLIIYITIAMVIVGCKKKEESGGVLENKYNTEITINMKSDNELKTTWIELKNKIKNNPDIETNFMQTYQQLFRKDVVDSNQADIQRLYNLIREPNSSPSSARNALEFFIKADANTIIRESLLNPQRGIPGWELVIISTKAIGSNKDKESLPYLIYTLQKNNYPQEGSEDATIHQTMKRDLIQSVQKITNLNIDISKIDVDNPDEMEKILSMARDWAKKNSIKLLGE